MCIYFCTRDPFLYFTDMHGWIVVCVIHENNVIWSETWWIGLREWAGGEDVSGGSGHVIEDVEGGTGGNGQMGALGADKKDAAAACIGYHFHPEKNLWTVCAWSIHSFVWSFLIPLNPNSFSFALTHGFYGSINLVTLMAMRISYINKLHIVVF